MLRKHWSNLPARLLRASDSSVREADCLKIGVCKPAKESFGKRFLRVLRASVVLLFLSNFNTENTELTRRNQLFPTDSEGGDRTPSAMPKSVARFAGFVLVFWPLFPAMNRWAIIDRPFADSFRSF